MSVCGIETTSTLVAHCHLLTKGLPAVSPLGNSSSVTSQVADGGRGGAELTGGKYPEKEMCAVYCFGPSALNNTVDTSSDCPEHEWTGRGLQVPSAPFQTRKLGGVSHQYLSSSSFFTAWVGVMFDFFRNAHRDQVRQQ